MSKTIYIHDVDPQPRLISQVVKSLRSGGIIIYPTDSGYAIGCMLDNKDAMLRIAKMRQLDNKHMFTLICKDLSEISRYAHVDNQSYRFIKHHTPGLYTFILKATKEVPRRLQNEKRKTIGIRVPNNIIVNHILNELNEPIISSSLKLPGNDYAEADVYSIDNLENSVDLIIDGGVTNTLPTSIIDMSNDSIEIIREGAGDLSLIR